MVSATETNSAPQLVIFDCDGVLVDSEAISARVTASYLTELGYALSEADVKRRFTGKSDRSMKHELFAETGREIPAGFDAEFIRRTNEAMSRELRAMPHIESVLEMLPRKCVASSGMPEKIANSLRVTGLKKFFADHEIFSAVMVAHGKPAPDLFLHAANALRIAPQNCVVIEDSVPGILASCAANMPVFGFTGGSHTDQMHGARLREAGAKHVFADMRVLPQLLAAQNLSEEGYAA